MVPFRAGTSVCLLHLASGGFEPGASVPGFFFGGPARGYFTAITRMPSNRPLG